MKTRRIKWVAAVWLDGCPYGDERWMDAVQAAALLGSFFLGGVAYSV